MKELTCDEKKEADAIAAVARRAEERAEKRAIERALEQRRHQREIQFPSTSGRSGRSGTSTTTGKDATSSTSSGGGSGSSKIMFVSKQARLKERQKEKEEALPVVKKKIIESSTTIQRFSNPTRHATIPTTTGTKRTIAGTSNDAKMIKKKKKKTKKSMFQFEWDASDDTMGQQEYGGLEDLYGPFPTSTSTATTTTTTTTKTTTSTMVNAMEEVSEKETKEMTSRDWRIFRENYNIMVRGGNVPPPLRTFADVVLHKNLTHAIKDVCGYKIPSPIQRQAIPIGLQQRDILGIAETGSGKTAAFGIPLCQMVLTKTNNNTSIDVAEDGPLGLVLAPTRELALQIHAELVKLLSTSTTIHTTCVVGGQSIQEQALKLRQGVHIVVGTPGRLNDCLDMRYLVLNQCHFIVLDEADRMIDLGFAPQMTSILDSISSNDRRVTAMFSATMPPQVEKMAHEYLHQPIIVSIGGHYTDGDSKNVRIQQRIQYLSSPQQKERALQNLIQTHPKDKILVFVNEKKHAEGVGRMIEKSTNKKVVILHGGKTQEQRMDALHAFKNYEHVIMVATDVAGRGLDIPNVTHVINYNVPSRSIDAYCHRIGRTGRAGKHGLATSLVTDEDESILPALVSYLQQTNMPIPHRLLHHPALQHNNNTNNF